MKTRTRANTKVVYKSLQPKLQTTLKTHCINQSSTRQLTVKNSGSSNTLISHKLDLIALSSKRKIINNFSMRDPINPKIICFKQSHQASSILKKNSKTTKKFKKFKKYFKRGKEVIDYADIQALKTHIKLASKRASNASNGRGTSGSKQFGHEVDIKIPVKNRYTRILEVSELGGSNLNKNKIYINKLKFHGKGFSNLVFDLSKLQNIETEVQNIKGIEILGINLAATMQIIVLGRERKAFVRIMLKREKSFLDKVPGLNKVLGRIEKFIGTSDIYFFPAGW